jgi:hypothetical protein
METEIIKTQLKDFEKFADKDSIKLVYGEIIE